MFALSSLSGSVVLSDSVVALTDAVKPVGASTPQWMEILIAVIGAAFTYVLIPYLKNKAAAAKAQAELSNTEANGAKLNLRDSLYQQVKLYVLMLAESAAEKEFPKLANKILAGELKDSESIKKYMREWGSFVKVETIAYFKAQGVDVVATFGESAIEAMVEWAANSTSPFQGKETAVELLNGGAKLVLEKGINKLREYTDEK